MLALDPSRPKTDSIPPGPDIRWTARSLELRFRGQYVGAGLNSVLFDFLLC